MEKRPARAVRTGPPLLTQVGRAVPVRNAGLDPTYHADRLKTNIRSWLPSVSRHLGQGGFRLGGDGPRSGLSEVPVLGL
jgi:hypothetical protein